jgi:hypothetical protein
MLLLVTLSNLLGSVSAQAATINWNTDSSGDFHDATKWDTATVPGAADTAVINRGVANPTVTYSGASGTRTVNSLQSEEAFVVSGGSLTLSSASFVNDTFTMTGGTLGPPGAGLTLGGTTTISGGATKTLSGGTVNNTGSASWTGGGTISAGSAAFNNSGTFTDGADNSSHSFIFGFGIQPTFSNSGTHIKQGTGTTTFTSLYNNTGTVNVQAGTLNLSGGGTSSGTFDVAGTLNFTANHTLNTGATFTGAGASRITGGTTTVAGTVTVGTSPGTLELAAGGTLTGGGTLNTAGTGAFAWTGGTLFNPTGLTLGGTTTISGAATKTFSGGTVNNTGSASWTGGGSISAGNSAAFNNSGTFTDGADNSSHSFIFGFGIQPTFSNSGTHIKQGIGTTTFTSLYNNTGTVNVQAGTLNLSGGGTSSGTFDVAAAGTLNFTANHTLNTGATFTGAGASRITGGTTTVAGTVQVGTSPGTLELAAGGTLTGGGTLNTAGTGAFAWTGGTLFNLAGLNLGGTTTISGAATKTFSGGTVNNTGSASWTGGGSISAGNSAAFNNSGTFTDGADNSSHSFIFGFGTQPTFTNSGTHTKQGTGTTTFTSFYNNTGTVNVQAGTLNLSGGVTQHVGTTLTGGTWNVLANSTLNITTGVDITTNNANVTLDGVNSNFARINPLATNNGSFSILNGRNFTRQGDFANAGMMTIGALSTFTVDGGAPNDYIQTGGSTRVDGTLIATDDVLINAGLLFGTGTIQADDVVLAGMLAPGTSPGILTIMGDYIQNPGGALNIEIGGLLVGSQFDRLVISGITGLADLSSANNILNIILINGFLPSVGDMFKIMTFNSLSGFFDTINVSGGNVTFAVQHNPTDVTLVVTQVQAAPEPPAALLLAGGLVAWLGYRRFTKSKPFSRQP